MENNKKGGFGRRTEGRREYGSNAGKRPRISRTGTRGAERVFSGENSERPRRSFGENAERPRRSFGENTDRPRRSFGEGAKRPRRSFGEGSERSFSGEKRPFRGEGRSFSGERKSFSGERRSFGGDKRNGGFKNAGKKSFTKKCFSAFSAVSAQFLWVVSHQVLCLVSALKICF